MAIQQQGDVILKQTPDDGEITVQDGFVFMDGGILTMAYLCLFGGNEEDDGNSQNALQYWGNRDETNKSRQYRSELQYLSTKIPLVSGNLPRINDAAKRDLQVFLDDGIATELSVESSIPALNTLQLDINLFAFGEEQKLSFTENWKAQTR